MTNPEGDDIIIVNIPDEFSPDGDGINDKLCIEVNGATKYDISVCDYNWPHDQYYIRTNIPIRTNHFCVWDGKCDYDDINCLLYHKCNRKRNIGLKFYNCDTNIYVTKTIYVECSNNKSENDSCSNYNINTLNSNYLSNILKFDINPNPTFDNTMISFNLYESDNIYLYIANLSGNIIKEIINQKFDKGLHNINIDISDLATGTYLCILETSNEIKKIKFIKM
ncbi:MAG TPA: T9SS type A sorting domain-containing protein [Bacteroidales bacterium]|nr:T9SS type A sorting domain-containing protein [Bacteroidales bacterium]